MGYSVNSNGLQYIPVELGQVVVQVIALIGGKVGAKVCSDICPRVLSVPRSEQFSESVARRKLRALSKR